MANYKPHHQSMFDVQIHPDDVPKTLESKEVSTVSKTLHDTANGLANYQVPAGKTFYIVGILVLNHASTPRDCTIFHATGSADGNSNQTNLIKFTSDNTTQTWYLPIPYQPSAPADTFLNWEVSNVTNAPFIKLYGYER